MLEIGAVDKLAFNNYTLYLKKLMGVEPGDKLYALKRGAYFTLMTREQYDKLLAKYAALIDRTTDLFKKRKLEEVRAVISVYKTEYIVSKDRFVYIGSEFVSSFNLSSREKLLVHRTENGYNFWHLNSFRSYFPEVLVFDDDEVSSNRRVPGDVRGSWSSYNADNSTCIFSVANVIDCDQEQYICLTRKDGFLEIRTKDEFEQLISGFDNAINKAKADERTDIAKLLCDMKQNIIKNSFSKHVNSEGRIYIPIEWARECGFCDESSTVVCCEIDEGVVRIVPAHRYEAYLASRLTSGEGKPK